MNTTYGPYTPVKQAGNFFFVSGQVGVDPASKTAQTDVASQTKQALANLGSLLDTAGLRPEHVVKTTVFLTDMGDFEAMNSAYEQSFTPPRPARSTVGVRELPRVADTQLLVEIEAVAYREAA